MQWSSKLSSAVARNSVLEESPANGETTSTHMCAHTLMHTHACTHASKHRYTHMYKQFSCLKLGILGYTYTSKKHYAQTHYT